MLVERLVVRFLYFVMTLLTYHFAAGDQPVRAVIRSATSTRRDASCPASGIARSSFRTRPAPGSGASAGSRAAEVLAGPGRPVRRHDLVLAERTGYRVPGVVATAGLDAPDGRLETCQALRCACRRDVGRCCGGDEDGDQRGGDDDAGAAAAKAGHSQWTSFLPVDG